jgi:hypothetical protein
MAVNHTVSWSIHVLANLVAFALAGAPCAAQADWMAVDKPTVFVPARSVTLPSANFRVLTPIATIQPPAINESSGIVRSLQHSGVYWTHNDSGDSARIFAIGLNGAAVGSSTGITISGAMNIDWEDIARGPENTLIVSDLGNNANARKDLAVYLLEEPDPAVQTAAPFSKKITVHYPEQTAFPPLDNNYDNEAIFWANDRMYALTKHRADNLTRLYRLDSMREGESNPLIWIGAFETLIQTTAADVSEDERTLAGLTYAGLWVFTLPEDAPTDNYFLGAVRWLPIANLNQAEAISFDATEENLIITNEQRQIFRVPMADLIEVAGPAF